MRFKNIAALVRKERLEKGVSQNALAQHLGYKNPQFISNVERAKCGIPIKKIKKLREFLLIDYHELESALISDYLTDINLEFRDEKLSVE
jgi:ribosome-binding protein aMBF1 (putative translation factor)